MENITAAYLMERFTKQEFRFRPVVAGARREMGVKPVKKKEKCMCEFHIGALLCWLINFNI